MALPVSPNPIAISDIETNIGIPVGTNYGINDRRTRLLAGANENSGYQVNLNGARTSGKSWQHSAKLYLNPTKELFPYNILVDNNYNYYSKTFDGASGGYDKIITKFNGVGDIGWCRAITDFGSWFSGTSDYTSSINAATGDTYHLVSTTYNDGSKYPHADFLLKVDASGVAQWQRGFYFSLTSTISQFDAYDAVTSVGGSYVYVCGNLSSSNSPTNSAAVVKLNSSGTEQWRRRVSFYYGSWNSYCINTGTNGLYYAGFIPDGSTGYVATLNADGTHGWLKTLSNNRYSVSICSDAYSGGFFAYLDDNTIVKFSSTGTIAWQKSINIDAGSYDTTIKTDSSGNLYVFRHVPTGNKKAIIKINKDGSIVSQLLVTPGWNVTNYPRPSRSQGFAVDDTNVYFLAQVGFNGNYYSTGMTHFKIPNTLSISGTVGTNYEAWSFAAASYTLTDTSITLSTPTAPTVETFTLTVDSTNNALRWADIAKTSSTLAI